MKKFITRSPYELTYVQLSRTQFFLASDQKNWEKQDLTYSVLRHMPQNDSSSRESSNLVVHGGILMSQSSPFLFVNQHPKRCCFSELVTNALEMHSPACS